MSHSVSEAQADKPSTSTVHAHDDAEVRPRRKWGLVAGGVAALAIGGAFLLKGGAKHAPPAAAAAEVTVQGDTVELSASSPQWRFLETSLAKRQSPLLPVPAPARILVDESRSAPVFAPLAGRVERVNVQLGQRVKSGEKLVAIRSSTLPELGREVESARAALAVKSAMVERVRDLVGLKAVPQKDLIAAEQERKETELSLKAAEGKRRSLRLGALDDSGLYWVTAPREGTIVERKALVGMEVGPDRTEPLLSVADVSEVIVVADVLETDIAGLKVGGPALVALPGTGSQAAEGKIEYIAELVDPVRRTVAVRVRVVNPEHKLHPNAFAQVTFGVGGDPRIVVPSEAVVTDDQKAVVFVKKPGSAGAARLEKREVRVGRVREGQTEILEGLNEGETYVARGALLVLNTVGLAR